MDTPDPIMLYTITSRRTLWLLYIILSLDFTQSLPWSMAPQTRKPAPSTQSRAAPVAKSTSRCRGQPSELEQVVEASGEEFDANNVCGSDDDDLPRARTRTRTRTRRGRGRVPYGPLVVDKALDPLLKSKTKPPSSTADIEYFFKEVPSGRRECVRCE